MLAMVPAAAWSRLSLSRSWLRPAPEASDQMARRMGGHPEEHSDEAADDRLAQGRRVWRRGLMYMKASEGDPPRCDRVFADLHAAARRQDPWRELTPISIVAMTVRAVGQHDAVV
jgi:hypothetical protein